MNELYVSRMLQLCRRVWLHLTKEGREHVQPVPTPVAMLSTERARFEQHTRVASSMVIESTTMDEHVSWGALEVLLGEGTAVTMLSRPAAATRRESIMLALVM